MNDIYQHLSSKYLQSYCLFPSSLAAAEAESGQNEIYRISTVNNESSGEFIDGDNTRYAIKKQYEMTLGKFMGWLTSAGETG